MLSNRRTLRVEFGDCDPSGIVFHPNYFAWFDASVHALLRAGGATLEQLLAEYGCDGIPLAESRIKFYLPSRSGDDLIIETTVTGIHRCAFDLHHRLLKDEALAVEVFETRIWTVYDTEQRRIRAQALPERMIQFFSGGDRVAASGEVVTAV